MSTVRPASESKLAFHLASLFFTLSRIKLKYCEEEPVCLIGKPRYFLREGVDRNPRMSQKDSLLSLSTLGEKKTLDLASFIVCPKRLQKSSNTFLIMEQLVASALAKRTKLSAKNI